MTLWFGCGGGSESPLSHCAGANLCHGRKSLSSGGILMRGYYSRDMLYQNVIFLIVSVNGSDLATLIEVFWNSSKNELPKRYKFRLEVSILNCNVVCHRVLVEGKKCTPRVIRMIYFPDTENNALHRVFSGLYTWKLSSFSKSNFRRDFRISCFRPYIHTYTLRDAYLA